MRSTTQLPDTEELKGIIAFEAKREVPLEKLDVHYPDFGSFVSLLDYFNLDAALMQRDISSEEWFGGAYQEKASGLIDELVGKILNDRSDDCRSRLNSIYDYLGEEDQLMPADAIFVFGAKTLLRAQKAIELYKSGLSKKLVFSGHGSYTGRGEATEAGIYRDLAVSAGIPVADILLEDKSITIPDNVRSCLNKFDEMGFRFESLILVNSPYSQRRGWCLFKKYLPDTVSLIRINCETGEKFSRESWFLYPEGIRVVLNEFIKMKIGLILNTA